MNRQTQPYPLHAFVEGLGVVLSFNSGGLLTQTPTPNPSRKAGRGTR